jgi:acetyl/propionyl-CoA carboxylase alpha subunit
MEVTPFYDPILSKLIVWSEDRESARGRMIAALNDYTILGIPTTIGFLADVISHPEFAAGRTHTHFVEQHFHGWKPGGEDGGLADIAMIAAALSMARSFGEGSKNQVEKNPTPWQATGKWSIGGA